MDKNTYRVVGVRTLSFIVINTFSALGFWRTCVKNQDVYV